MVIDVRVCVISEDKIEHVVFFYFSKKNCMPVSANSAALFCFG